jgi:N-acetyl-gamma-glutamyl-phosphate reductase
MQVRVSIAGASGYAGGELIRLLANHPNFELSVLAANSKAGQTVATVHPQFIGTELGDMLIGETNADALATELIFLALPHGASGELAHDIRVKHPESMIVDLGADHRLGSAEAWNNYYGPQYEFAGQWIYGLPELHGQADLISQSLEVANPGCYATAIALAFMPALANGLIEESTLTAVAASGTSGAGKSLSESLLATNVMGSMSPYKVGGIHQHIPEIEQTLNMVSGVHDSRLTFTPILAPMPRGIIATCSGTVVGTNVDTDTIRALYRDYFRTAPFVAVLDQDVLPSTGAVLGSNSVQISVDVDPRTHQLIVIAVLDNLVKGAAGQAIQNANLMNGFDQSLGLPTVGVMP